MNNISDEDKELIYGLIKEELSENYEKLEKLINCPYYSDAFNYSDKDDKVQLLYDNIICINTEDTKNSFLRLKNQYTNNPYCEISNEEKFISFFNFVHSNLDRTTKKKSCHLDVVFSDSDYWFFSKNNGKSNIISSMIWHDSPSKIMNNTPYKFRTNNEEFEYKIKTLLQFGRKIDDYIQEKQDFYALDYIIEASSNESSSAFAIVKLFSLLETLIAHKNYTSLRQELLNKLPRFLPDDIEDKELWIKLVYDIRNKIAHGDYKGLVEKTDQYLEIFMIGWNLDYYEFSKINWVYSSVYSTLNTVVANIVWSMIYTKPLVKKIKQYKCENKWQQI